MKWTRIAKGKKNPKQLTFDDIGSEEFIFEKHKSIIDKNKLDTELEKHGGRRFFIEEVEDYVKHIPFKKESIFCKPEELKSEILKRCQEAIGDTFIYFVCYRKNNLKYVLLRYVYNNEIINEEKINKIILGKMIAYIKGINKL